MRFDQQISREGRSSSTRARDAHARVADKRKPRKQPAALSGGKLNLGLGQVTPEQKQPFSQLQGNVMHTNHAASAAPRKKQPVAGRALAAAGVKPPANAPTTHTAHARSRSAQSAAVRSRSTPAAAHHRPAHHQQHQEQHRQRYPPPDASDQRLAHYHLLHAQMQHQQQAYEHDPPPMLRPDALNFSLDTLDQDATTTLSVPRSQQPSPARKCGSVAPGAKLPPAGPSANQAGKAARRSSSAGAAGSRSPNLQLAARHIPAYPDAPPPAETPPKCVRRAESPQSRNCHEQPSKACDEFTSRDTIIAAASPSRVASSSWCTPDRHNPFATPSGPKPGDVPSVDCAWLRLLHAARADFSGEELSMLFWDTLSKLVSFYGITEPMEVARIELTWKEIQAARSGSELPPAAKDAAPAVVVVGGGRRRGSLQETPTRLQTAQPAPAQRSASQSAKPKKFSLAK
eukprot:gene16064-24596_t